MASFWTRQRIPVDRFRVLYPREEAPALIGYALFYTFLSGVVGYLIRSWPMPLLDSHDFLVDCWYLCFKASFLFLLPTIVFHRLGYTWRDLAPAGLSTRDYVWSAAALVAGAYWNGFGFRDIAFNMQAGLQSQMPLRIVLGFAIPLVFAALPEEFFFRGWLQTRLERRWGRVIAVLVTAALFTAWHVPARYFLAFGVEGEAGNLTSILRHAMNFIFPLGLVFGLLWDRYRRILPLIALHYGMDLMPWIVAILGVRR